jgi:hypothetical protein
VAGSTPWATQATLSPCATGYGREQEAPRRLDGEGAGLAVRDRAVAAVPQLAGAGPHVRGCWAADLLLGKA